MSTITTVLFDLDGTLLPMDQDLFVKTYFSGIAKKVAPLGYEPEKLIKTIWTGTAAMVKNTGEINNEEAFWLAFAAAYGEDSFFDWRVFLIMLTLAVILALVTDYICFVPLAASTVFPFVYGGMAKNIGGAAILLIVTAVIAIKHIENLRRIANGTEMHLSYIWKPEKEMERMKQNLVEDSSAVEEHFSANNNSIVKTKEL